MIELKHVLMAEQAIVNKLNGQLSIINLINGITMPNLPQEISPLFLVMNWQRDRKENTEDINFDIRILVKYNDELIKHKSKAPTISVDMPKGEYIVNTIGVMNLRISSYGEYRVIVEKKTDKTWVEMGSVSVEVTAADKNSHV